MQKKVISSHLLYLIRQIDSCQCGKRALDHTSGPSGTPAAKPLNAKRPAGRGTALVSASTTVRSSQFSNHLCKQSQQCKWRRYKATCKVIVHYCMSLRLVQGCKALTCTCPACRRVGSLHSPVQLALHGGAVLMAKIGQHEVQKRRVADNLREMQTHCFRNCQ